MLKLGPGAGPDLIGEEGARRVLGTRLGSDELDAGVALQGWIAGVEGYGGRCGLGD